MGAASSFAANVPIFQSSDWTIDYQQTIRDNMNTARAAGNTEQFAQMSAANGGLIGNQRQTWGNNGTNFLWFSNFIRNNAKIFLPLLLIIISLFYWQKKYIPIFLFSIPVFLFFFVLVYTLLYVFKFRNYILNSNGFIFSFFTSTLLTVAVSVVYSQQIK